jgi:hypothetical protein
VIISIETDLRPEDCGCEAGLMVPLAAAASSCALPHRTSSLLLPSTFLPFPLLMECSECLKITESGLRIPVCFVPLFNKFRCGSLIKLFHYFQKPFSIALFLRIFF